MFTILLYGCIKLNTEIQKDYRFSNIHNILWISAHKRQLDNQVGEWLFKNENALCLVVPVYSSVIIFVLWHNIYKLIETMAIV